MTHPIFIQHPLAAEKVHTSTGPQPTPYHVYDGHAVLIGGTADYEAVAALLADEQVTPVKTESGRTLMAMWAVDESEASHGAHTELQFSFYVTHRPVEPLPDSSFAVLKFLLDEPEALQMVHGLWNNTQGTVAYNREILGLTPKLARSSFSRGDGRVIFAFHDAESGTLLARGDVREVKRPTLGATVALFRSFGLRGAMRAASMKTIEARVVNPISEVLPRNADALTVAAPDSIVAQLFDPAQDRLEIAHGVYGALDFAPTFVEHMRGFRMVYLNPV